MKFFRRGKALLQYTATPVNHSQFHTFTRPTTARALLLGALWLLAALPGLAPARALPFTDHRDKLTSGTSPFYKVIPADFNRDGWPDLLTHELTSGGLHPTTCRIALNINQGTLPPSFEHRTIYAHDSYLSCIAAADLDGDADLDIIFDSNADQEALLVWLENEDGAGSSWSAPQTILDYSNPIFQIFAVDFDQDGDLDIVANPKASNGGPSKWGWVENTAGDGSAWEFRPVPGVTSEGFMYIGVADVDLNGAPDILGFQHNEDLRLLLMNNGANPPVFTLEPVSMIHTLGPPVFGDVWGDRRPEFFGRDSYNIVYWYRDTGAGWKPEMIDDAVSVFSGLTDLDFNGNLDALCAYDNGRSFWYEYDDPLDPWIQNKVNSTASSGSARPTDIDRDGDLDWVHIYNVGNAFGIYTFYNTDPHKQASFLPPRDINTAANGVRDIMAVHLNEDRWLDVVGAFYDGDNIQFNLGEGPNYWTFETGRIVGSGTPANDVAALDAGRVDRDGRIDLVSAAAGSGQIRYWQNQGVETPTPFIGYLVDSLEGAKEAALGDLDRDGDLDIVAVGRSCTSDIIPICTATLVWYEQTGDPTLPGSWTQRQIGSARTDFPVVAVGDMDLDGDLDIVAAYRNTSNPPVQITTNAIQWFENDGASPPTFTPHTIVSTIGGSSVQTLRVVDMDGDADLDVLAADFTGDGVRWHENTAGDGSAWTAQPIAAGFDAVRAVDAADVDQDGDMDVLVASHDDNTLYVLENDGGAWPILFQYLDLLGPRTARFADLNNNGAHDILAGFDVSDKLVWFPGTVGSFTLSSFDIAPATADEGAEVPVLRAELTNWARAGEKSIIPNKMALVVRNQNMDPLVGSQIKTIISHVALYADSNGSGVFDGGDALVTKIPSSLLPDAAEGVLLDLNTQTGGALATVEPGNSRAFFGVVGIQPGASSTSHTHFSIEMVDIDDEEAIEIPTTGAQLRERIGLREATPLIAIQDVVFSLDGWLLR